MVLIWVKHPAGDCFKLAGRRLVRNIINSLREEGTAVFLNSHLLGEIELTCDRVAFIVAVFLGSLGSIDLVWLLSDILNGLMALPNLIGLILLAGVIVAETRSYFQRVGRHGDMESARGGGDESG